MKLSELLRNNPPYSDALAGQVLTQYLRMKHGVIERLHWMGADYDDVEQELRIELWQAWTRWDGRIPLQRWLSYKVDYKLRQLARACAIHRRKMPTVSWEDLQRRE